jgi:hypothetical protein
MPLPAPSHNVGVVDGCKKKLAEGVSHQHCMGGRGWRYHGHADTGVEVSFWMFILDQHISIWTWAGRGSCMSAMSGLISSGSPTQLLSKRLAKDVSADVYCDEMAAP